MTLLEVMRSVIDYEWESEDDVNGWEGDASAYFYVADDDLVIVDFRPCNLDGFAAVDFARNGQVELTGGGSAGTVFATVSRIITDFVKRNPSVGIVFEATDREVSRVKFYKRTLLPALETALKFKSAYAEIKQGHLFVLAKTQPKVDKAVRTLTDEGYEVDHESNRFREWPNDL